MPNSRMASAASAGSSVGSGYSKRYRTKSKHSDVDETLFAQQCKSKLGNQVSSNQELCRGPRKSGLRSTRSKPEFVQLLTKDLIRNLVIPSKDPSGLTIILKSDNYERLKNAAKFRTKEEIQREYEMSQLEKDQAMEAAKKRKDDMKLKEVHRKQNEKLNDLEMEAKEKAEYLLENANSMRMEQEDEVKHLNELIFNAKCHAIRDAQILEKKAITSQLDAENKRLHKMMEIDRIKAIKTQEEIENCRREERYAGAKQIMTQIEANSRNSLLEQEKRDQESQSLLKYMKKLHMEDLRNLEKKVEEQRHMQRQIQLLNQEDVRRKQLKADQESLADQKVVEYMKKKAEREAQFEMEQEKIRKDKELEVVRLRTMQERARDHQAEQDALRAKRNQEQAERDWRRKEALEAERKAEMNEIMKQARTEQVQAKEHFMAVQAQRERTEFERVLREQQRLAEKERLKEEAIMKVRMRHAKEIRKQIFTKQELKVRERRQYFEEAVKMEEEAKLRRIKLDEVKQKKLDNLRKAGVHDKYCSEVERRMNAPHGLVF